MGLSFPTTLESRFSCWPAGFPPRFRPRNFSLFLAAFTTCHGEARSTPPRLFFFFSSLKSPFCPRFSVRIVTRQRPPVQRFTCTPTDPSFSLSPPLFQLFFLFIQRIVFLFFSQFHCRCALSQEFLSHGGHFPTTSQHPPTLFFMRMPDTFFCPPFFPAAFPPEDRSTFPDVRAAYFSSFFSVPREVCPLPMTA